MGYRMYRFKSSGDEAKSMVAEAKEVVKKAHEMLEVACEMLDRGEVRERGGMGYRRDNRGRFMEREDWDEPQGRYEY